MSYQILEAMKTIITSSLLIASMGASQFAFATENLNVEVSMVENRKALVEVSHDSGKLFEISIINPIGENIYFHQTGEISSEFRKNLDLSQLDEGTYKLRVKSEGGSKEQLINIDKSGISYGEEITKTDPFFSFKNNRLNLSFINHRVKPMNIYVYNRGELVFEKQLDKKVSISRAFDFSNLKNGE